MALNTDSTDYLTVRRLWSIMSSFKDKIVTALGKKSDKSSTVSNVAWSSSKLTKTINGTTTDVVSASTLKSAMSLNNVTNDAQVKRSEMGTASGVATLDANGIINASQLPSYVDDVLEYSAKSQFPATGETGKIYVDTSTNLTWRWSGTTYVEISPSLALGETDSTAYRGDRGKTAYDHSQLTSGNPHNVTAADVKAVRYDTNAQGLTSTQKGNARTNIGLGTAAVKDVPSSGNASTTQVVMGNDSRLTDSRTPTSHKSPDPTYGVGDSSNYGHVKLYDSVENENTDGAPTQNAVHDALEGKADASRVVAIADATVERSSATEWFMMASHTYSKTGGFIWNATWLATINVSNTAGVPIGGVPFFLKFAARFSDSSTAPSASEMSFTSSPVDSSMKSLINGIKFKMVFDIADGAVTAKLYYSPRAAYRLLALREIMGTISNPKKTKQRWDYTSYGASDAGESTEPTGTASITMDWVYSSPASILLTSSDDLDYVKGLGGIGTVTGYIWRSQSAPTNRPMSPENYAAEMLVYYTDDNYAMQVVYRSASGIWMRKLKNGEWDSSWTRIVTTADISDKVDGPSSATADNIVIFDGTTGKVIKDSNIPKNYIQYHEKYSSSSSIIFKVCSMGNLDSGSSMAEGFQFVSRYGASGIFGSLLNKNGLKVFAKVVGARGDNQNYPRFYWVLNSTTSNIDIYVSCGTYVRFSACPLPSTNRTDFSDFSTTVSVLPAGATELTINFEVSTVESSGTAPAKVDEFGNLTACTVDSTPTDSSPNLVTSGGVKSALDGKADADRVVSKADVRIYTQTSDTQYYKIAECNAPASYTNASLSLDYWIARATAKSERGTVEISARPKNDDSYGINHFAAYQQKKVGTVNYGLSFILTMATVGETVHMELWASLSQSYVGLFASSRFSKYNGRNNGTSIWSFIENPDSTTTAPTQPSGGLLATATPSFDVTVASTSAVGSGTEPVYVDANGDVQACTGGALHTHSNKAVIDGISASDVTNWNRKVDGPSSATSGNFPVFDGTTGKLIKNSSYSEQSFVAIANAYARANGTANLWCKLAEQTWTYDTSQSRCASWLVTFFTSSGAMTSESFFLNFAMRGIVNSGAPVLRTFSTSIINTPDAVSGRRFKMTVDGTNGSYTFKLYYTNGSDKYCSVAIRELSSATQHAMTNARSGWTYTNYSSNSGDATEPVGTVANYNCDFVYASSLAVASAAKIATSAKIGDTNKPVYIDADGTVTPISYTIATSVPSNAAFTDTKVTQNLISTSGSYPVILKNSTTATDSPTSTVNYGASITANPSTGQLHATTFDVNSKCTLQFNTTTNALDFVFN